MTPRSSATSVPSSTYDVFKDKTVTIPEYIDSDSAVNFIGWKVTKYCSSPSGNGPFSIGGRIYQPGEILHLESYTMGDIELTAITDTFDSLSASDQLTIRVNSEAPTVNYYTYHIGIKQGDTIVTAGQISIGDNLVQPSSDGSYELVLTSNSPLPIKIGGREVGQTATFSENISNTTIQKMTVRVSGMEVTSLKATDYGTLNTEGRLDSGVQIFSAYSVDDGTLFVNSYDICVNGENTGKTIRWGETTDVVYHTLTVQFNLTGMDKSDIKRVELKHPDTGNALFMNYNSETGVATYVKLYDDTAYEIFVNGEKTTKHGSFETSHTVTVDFTRYTTLVQIYRDSEPYHVGDVYFGETPMVRVSAGMYQLMTNSQENKDIFIDGKKVREDVSSGQTYDINYYTVQYEFSDDERFVDTQQGTLPIDETEYLGSTNVTMMEHTDILNGAWVFAGWKIGDTVYHEGDAIQIAETIHAKAAWTRADISTAMMQLSERSFPYNDASQIPEITVIHNGIELVRGTDYDLTFTNSNTYAGSDATVDRTTMNVGTVTVTATGLGVYEGSVSDVYTIEPADPAEIILTNKITGTAGDKTKTFQINVEFTLSDDAEGMAMTMPETITCMKGSESEELQVTDNKVTVALGDKETAILYNVPRYIKYTITPVDARGYTFTGGPEDAILTSSAEIYVDFHKDMAIPTGTNVDAINPRWFLVFMIFAVTGMIVVKRKNWGQTP